MINDNDITDKGAESLFLGISSIKNLSYLVLMYRKNPISHKGAKWISAIS